MASSKTYPNAFVRGASLLAAIAIGTTGAQAQSFDFILDQNTSSVTLQATFGVTMDASLKGDYDAITNPTGTQTLPGLFGGSGNNDIPIDLGLGGDLIHMGTPTGSINLDVDELGLTFSLDELDVDLLGGASASSAQTLDLLFNTFRSVNPDSLYFGGIPVSFPLAGQSVSDLLVQQSGGAVPGILIPGIGAGSYGMTALVPVTFSMVVDFQGTPTPVGPFDGVLPVVGSLLMNTGGSPTLNITFNQTIQQTTLDPLPGTVISDLPFPAPTILPPGSTANLLISGSIEQVDLNMTIDTQLNATGMPDCGFTSYCAAVPNSTGFVGQLNVMGSADVSLQDLTLNSTDLPLNVFGYYLMSPAQGSLALPAPSQGILCVGAPLYRFNSSILYSGMGGTMSLGVDFNNLPQGQVFSAGSVWNFQLWHRDMNPSNTSNTTNAVSVQFCQ
ncbi:MAG: hypothetical protein P1V35_12365 [Planctomycetota bacterium]|nr:hypothetical protein [Planctomycetota bacterium]